MTAVNPTPVAAVRLPAAGLCHQVRGAAVVWQREMIRFGRDRSRIVSSLVQPVLFLFVLGTGLSSLIVTMAALGMLMSFAKREPGAKEALAAADPGAARRALSWLGLDRRRE